MPLTKVKSGGVSDSITLTSPDINAPDIDGGTIDNAVIGGSTAAAGSFTTITATGGSSSNWNTAYGWGDHSTQSYATQTYVGTEVSNLVDSSPAALDTLNELAAALGDDPNFATTVTNSIALKAPLASPSFTGTATMDGLTVDNITIDGNEIDVSSGNLTLDVAGTITLDADNTGTIYLSDGGTNYGLFFQDSNRFFIQSQVSDADMLFRGSDAGAVFTALTLDMSAAGAATFNSTIASAGVTSSNSITMTAGNMSLNSTSDGNQAFRYYRADGTLVVQQYPYNNRFNVQTYNNQGLRLKSDGSGQIELEGNVVINEDSADVDFRVESDGNANMLFVDGGNNRVGFGLSNPAQSFAVQFATADRVGTFYDTGTNGNSMYNGAAVLGVSRSSNGSTSLHGPIFEVGRDNGLNATYNVSDRFLTVRSDSTVINEDSQDHDFRVESQGYSRALHVDAGTDDIRMGGTNTQPWGQTSGVGTFQYKIAEHTAQISTDSATGYANLYLNKFNITADDTRLIAFYVNGNQVATITGSTTGATYNTTSDRRLKKDIKTITNGTDKLMAMNPVTHGWKADPEADTVHGFIAQEMMAIVPEAVSGDPKGEDMMSMDYGRITPVIVAALQDAHKKIAGLETRLNELEGK